MDRKRKPDRPLEGEVSLTRPDYSRCIICQKVAVKGLMNIQQDKFAKLTKAINARQDSVAKRLQKDTKENETWLNRTPKWHSGCRNWYINQKSLQLVQKKRLQDVTTEDPQASTSTGYPTRSAAPHFESKKMCVICVKRYYRRKLPNSKVCTRSSEKAINSRAKLLDREDILLRIAGAGHDMVANDICYTGIA